MHYTNTVDELELLANLSDLQLQMTAQHINDEYKPYFQH